MILLLIAFALGILAGVITGLIPGIHINLIAVLLLGYASLFLTYFSPIALVIFIVAMSITHTFLDFLPSIYLGAPDTDTELSLQPGHEMLIKGRAYEATILTLYGSLAAIVLTLLLTPLFLFILPKIYLPLNNIMPFILIIASASLFYFEKKSRIWALIIFLLAGFLGLASFNLNIKEPLLPLLTGLFGASSLIISIKNKQKIPKQKIKKLKHIIIKKKSIAKSLFASLIASPLVSFLPGLGSGQAAVIGSEVTGELDRKEFLVLLGSINTMVAGLAFLTLYSINKARTGASIAVSQIIAELTLTQLLMILGAILLSGIIASFLTLLLAKIISKNITKINYTKISMVVLAILTLVVFLFSGFFGLLVFVVSASLGITCIQIGIRRIHLMGALLIPIILFYLI